MTKHDPPAGYHISRLQCTSVLCGGGVAATALTIIQAMVGIPQSQSGFQAEALEVLGACLRAAVGSGGTLTLRHPAETRLLRALDQGALRAFASRHGLNVVRRLGGLVYDFTRKADA